MFTTAKPLSRVQQMHETRKRDTCTPGEDSQIGSKQIPLISVSSQAESIPTWGSGGRSVFAAFRRLRQRDHFRSVLEPL